MFLLKLCQSQYNIENCFFRYLQHNDNPKLMDSKKTLKYREKLQLNHYISSAGTYWMLLFDPFLVLKMPLTLDVNIINC